MKRYRHEHPQHTRWKLHMQQWARDFEAERRRIYGPSTKPIYRQAKRKKASND